MVRSLVEELSVPGQQRAFFLPAGSHAPGTNDDTLPIPQNFFNVTNPQDSLNTPFFDASNPSQSTIYALTLENVATSSLIHRYCLSEVIWL